LSFPRYQSGHLAEFYIDRVDPLLERFVALFPDRTQWPLIGQFVHDQLQDVAVTSEVASPDASRSGAAAEKSEDVGGLGTPPPPPAGMMPDPAAAARADELARELLAEFVSLDRSGRDDAQTARWAALALFLHGLGTGIASADRDLQVRIEHAAAHAAQPAGTALTSSQRTIQQVLDHHLPRRPNA